MDNQKSKAKRKVNIKKLIVISFLSIMFIVFGCILIGNMADVSRLQNQYSQCQVQYDKQIKENNKVKSVLNSDNKDEYIQQKAREKGYVKDGEVVFYDISSSK